MYYDDGLIQTFERLGGIFRHDVSAIELIDCRQLLVEPEGVETFRRLRSAIPPDQRTRLAGTLDVRRHSDSMFTLVLESGAEVRGASPAKIST
jgi:hypothetical protein